MVAEATLPNYPVRTGYAASNGLQAVGKVAPTGSPYAQSTVPTGQPKSTPAANEDAANGSPPTNLLGQESLLFLQENSENLGATPDLAKQYTDLSTAERAEVQELRTRDQEVRSHERAHQTAAGQYAGTASFEFETGPDGNRYAVSGEVSIDVSPESDPQATIDKMETIRRAAMAPGDPSSQDHLVAAQADQQIREAQIELQHLANSVNEDAETVTHDNTPATEKSPTSGSAPDITPIDLSESPAGGDGPSENPAQAANFYSAYQSNNRYQPLDTFAAAGKV